MMSRLMNCLRRNARTLLKEKNEGSAIVEMALSSMVLFAMFFGIFEGTMACYTYNYVSDAARQATRWAIVRGSTCHTNTPALDHCSTSAGASTTDISNYVKTLGYPGINSTAHMTVTTTYYKPGTTQPVVWTSCTTGTCNTPGNKIKVVVKYDFPLSIPYVPRSTISVTSTSQMVIAQ